MSRKSGKGYTKVEAAPTGVEVTLCYARMFPPVSVEEKGSLSFPLMENVLFICVFRVGVLSYRRAKNMWMNCTQSAWIASR